MCYNKLQLIKYVLEISGNLFQLDFSEVNMKELEKNLTFVEKGGWYRPANCTCHRDKKVGIKTSWNSF